MLSVSERKGKEEGRREEERKEGKKEGEREEGEREELKEMSRADDKYYYYCTLCQK